MLSEISEIPPYILAANGPMLKLTLAKRRTKYKIYSCHNVTFVTHSGRPREWDEQMAHVLCPRRDIPSKYYPNSPAEVRALSLHIYSELYRLRALSQGVTEVGIDIY